MKALRIVVCGATGNVGLAVIRALARSGHTVFGADKRRLPFGLHSRFSERYRLYPHPNDPDCLPKIQELLADIQPDVFLPSSTGLVRLVCKNQSSLAEHTRLLVPSAASFDAACDNKETISTCDKLGIAAPRIHDEYPDAPLAVVKPRQDVGAGRGVVYVSSAMELERARAEVEKGYGEVLVQEYIPGPAQAMRTVVLLFDNDSRLIGYFTTRKIRQWPNTGGTTALSISTDERELVDYVLPLFERWQWSGPAEVELKIDSRDGKPKVIEVNARFTSYVGFPILCGLNLPELTCLAAADRLPTAACPEYAVGRKYLAPGAYARSAWHELRHQKPRGAVVGKVANELLGGFNMNPGAWSDPLPRIGKALLEIRDAF